MVGHEPHLLVKTLSAPSLHCLQAHLAAASQRSPGLELRVICDRFPRLAGVRVVGRRWSSATEAAQLAECDVGISWLPDDPWSRGKCGLKVLQYMAAGLPVVANPVAMNRQMVVHGRTGLLVNTPEEWASAIRRLATDPPLRQRMGAAGRELVERQYSVPRWGPDFATLVVQAADRAAAAAKPHGRSAHVGPARRPSRNGPVPAESRFLPRQSPRDAALERQP